MQLSGQYPLRRRAAGRNYPASGRWALAQLNGSAFWRENKFFGGFVDGNKEL